MTDEKCLECHPVTQLECKSHREQFGCTLKEHEDWMDKKDIQDARNSGVMELQAKLLWGILGTGVLSFIVNNILPYTLK